MEVFFKSTYFQGLILGKWIMRYIRIILRYSDNQHAILIKDNGVGLCLKEIIYDLLDQYYTSI